MRHAVALLLVALLATEAKAQEVKTQGTAKVDSTRKLYIRIPSDTVHDSIPVKVPVQATTPAPRSTARRNTRAKIDSSALKAKAASNCPKNAQGVMSCPPDTTKVVVANLNQPGKIIKDSTIRTSSNTVTTDSTFNRLLPPPPQQQGYVRRTWWQENRGWVIPTGVAVGLAFWCVNRKDKCGTQAHNEAHAEAIAINRLPLIGVPLVFRASQ